MTSEERELAKRFAELSERAYLRGIYTETAFLTAGEQAVLEELRLSPPPAYYGGYGNAERRIAVFGNEESCFYPYIPSVKILKIEPSSQKFADKLTHRDFLGSILNLGIKREVTGDIVVHENCGYLFCLEEVAELIVGELTRVKHTPVRVSCCESLPDGAGSATEEKEIVAASPRLDAVISSVYDLSRSEGKALVSGEKVSVDSRLCRDPAKELAAGDRVSVRGYGRFFYDGEVRETKSGRQRIKVRIFV